MNTTSYIVSDSVGIMAKSFLEPNKFVVRKIFGASMDGYQRIFAPDIASDSFVLEKKARIIVTLGQVVLIDVDTIGRKVKDEITPLQRIKNRMPLMVQHAKEYRATYGDPIDNLRRLFADRELDPKRWEDIIDEPYGGE